MTERRKAVPQTKFEIPNLIETKEGLKIRISEDNSSIWGLIINNALKIANDKEVVNNRFISLYLINKDNTEDQLAFGIWDQDYAETIAKRYEIGYQDFSLIKTEKEADCTFDCDKKVFCFLKGKNVFMKDKKDGRNNKYYMSIPKLFGENRSILEVNIFSLPSCRDGRVKLNFQIVTNK